MAVALATALVAAAIAWGIQEVRIADRTSALDEARGAAAAAEGELGRVVPLVGLPIAEGRHFGQITMLSATQEPPMIAFDRQLLLTGEEGMQAAIEDGVEVDPNQFYHYIRDPWPAWQILAVDPDAPVILQSWRFAEAGGYHTEVVTLEQFGRIYERAEPENLRFRSGYYTITVRGDRVVEIEEMNLSP